MAIASSQEDNGNGRRRSNGNEEGENGAATVRSKVDEYIRISDLSGFGNLRAMMEAEALMKKKKRVQNCTNVDSRFYLMADGLPNPQPIPAGPPAPLPARNTSGISNLVVYVSAPLPAIASSQEDNGKRKSTGDGEGENGAATVRSEVDEYTLISDLRGFDNLRAMMEAEALMRKKKRDRNYTNVDSHFYLMADGLPNPPPFPAGPPASLPASNTSGVSNLVVYVSAPLPASSQEDSGNGKRRSTGNEGGENVAATVRSEVDEHTLISDLSGFDNLRAMMEAEALMKKKKKKKKKKRVQNYTNVDSYFRVEHTTEEKGQLGKDEAVHTVEKSNAESIQVSEIDVPQNLFEHVTEEKGQLDQHEAAVHTVEKSNAESVQVSEIDVPQNLFIDYAKEEEDVGTVKAVGTTKVVADDDVENSVEVINSCLSSPEDDATITSVTVWEHVGDTAANDMRKKRKIRKETKLITENDMIDNYAKEENGIKDNVVLQILHKKPRYFDPPSCEWGSCSISAANCKVRKQDKPCFRCDSFEHVWKFCKQKSNCIVRHGRNDLGNNLISYVCLRCGDLGHDMFSCRVNYPADDLKKIQCYVCKNFGHLCCVNFPDTGRKQVSCYNCGQYGHMGSECIKSHRVPRDTTSSVLCYKCGKEGHYAQKCSTHLVWRRVDYLTSNTERTQMVPEN